jgi:DNA-directed RNA polymerase subunit alpha
MSDANVSSINERAAEEYFRRALDAEKDAQHEKAIELYERALNENPDHEPTVFNLAVMYDRRAEDAKAIELYERICTSPPVHLNALMNLAILYEDNNHYDEAHRCLDAVLRTDPNHPRARLYLKDVDSARSMYYDEDNDRGDKRNQVMEIPVTDFELSVRSRNCLKKKLRRCWPARACGLGNRWMTPRPARFVAREPPPPAMWPRKFWPKPWLISNSRYAVARRCNA